MAWCQPQRGLKGNTGRFRPHIIWYKKYWKKVLWLRKIWCLSRINDVVSMKNLTSNWKVCSGSLLRGPANSNLFDARFTILTCFYTCSNPNRQPCCMAVSTQKILPIFSSTYCASTSRHCKCWEIQPSTTYLIGISILSHLWSKTETERHTVERSTKIKYIFLNGFVLCQFS